MRECDIVKAVIHQAIREDLDLFSIHRKFTEMFGSRDGDELLKELRQSYLEPEKAKAEMERHRAREEADKRMASNFFKKLSENMIKSGYLDNMEKRMEEYEKKRKEEENGQ